MSLSRTTCALFAVVLLAGVSLPAQDPPRQILDRSALATVAVTGIDDARALIASHATDLRLAASGLSTGEVLEASGTGRLHRAYRFRQTVAGIEVENSEILFLTTGDGRAVLLESEAGNVDAHSAWIGVTKEQAVSAVLGALAGGDRVLARDLELELVMRRRGFGREGERFVRPYWRVEVSAGGVAGDGQPMLRRVYVDAGDHPRVVASFSSSCASDTKIQHATNHLPPGDVNATLAAVNDPSVQVGFFCAYGGGPSVVSGPAGTFALPPGYTCTGPSGPGAINVLGRWGTAAYPDLDLWNGYGPFAALAPAFGGGPGVVGGQPAAGGVMFPGSTIPPDLTLTGAAAEVAYSQQQLRAFTATHPTVLGGVRVTAEVEIAPFSAVSCATIAGGLNRVRFASAGFEASRGVFLANSASSTIVTHEIGHLAWWHSTASGRWNDDDAHAINEGVADIFAMFVTGQSEVGLAWLGSGTGSLRSGTNLRPYAAFDPEGDAHTSGELLMGAFWKMRANLQASLGAAAGAAKAQGLFLDWLVLFDDVTIDSRIMEHLLVLDDTDANVANGTPDLAAIVAAFQAHGYPGADPALVGTGPTPVLGAGFFDPAGAPLRSSKIALSVFDPRGGAGKALIVIAGSAGSSAAPPFGTFAVDLAQPFFVMIDGLTAGNGVFPDFPATTDAAGAWASRENATPFWGLPPGIPFTTQAFVFDPVTPANSRLTNGVALATP